MEVFFYFYLAIVSGEPISPQLVFDCGQAFRFRRHGAAMQGVAYSRLLSAEETSRGLELFPVTREDFESIWRRYFDLDLSYGEIASLFAKDPVLRRAIPLCRGMRVLNQEPFETLLSFLISQNNNIPRIRGIIEKICAEQGEEIAPRIFAFPTPEQLARVSPERFRQLGAGYRADYLAEASRAVAEGRFDLSRPFGLDYAQAKAYLMTLKGVGPKVADCVLLFAYGKRDAFPKDVWIKRVLKQLYGFTPRNDEDFLRFSQEHFGSYGGIAQQYLFHYARQCKLENQAKVL